MLNKIVGQHRCEYRAVKNQTTVGIRMLLLALAKLLIQAVFNSRLRNGRIAFYSYSLVFDKCIPITASASPSLIFVRRHFTSLLMWPFLFWNVLVCGHFGLSLRPLWSRLWPFWFVAVLDVSRIGTSRHQAVLCPHVTHSCNYNQNYYCRWHLHAV